MNKRVTTPALFAAIVLSLAMSAWAAGSPGREMRPMTKRLSRTPCPFGVLAFLNWNHPWNNFKYPDRASLEQAVALMKRAGIAMVRMDFLWEDIEPEQGDFKFDKYDTIVEVLHRNNIEVLGLLNYSTAWASSDGTWNNPPRDNSLFVTYARAVISRYKDRVRYWEVWNEPDSPTYWENQDGLVRYCGVLKDVYLEAKKIDPGLTVLNGGLASGLSSVNRLYDNGARGYFDALNIHIFETPLDPLALKRAQAYIERARTIMIRHGDKEKKIWITEIGCPGVPEASAAGNWWMGQNPDEKQQAAWVEQVFSRLVKEEAVERVFWAFFRDCKEHWHNGVDYFGLVRWDFSAKPSFDSFRKCRKKWMP